jgi:hypothetical protein
MAKTTETSADGQTFTRDYFIRLRVSAPIGTDVAVLDSSVAAVVEYSTAVEAIGEGLYYSKANLGTSNSPFVEAPVDDDLDIGVEVVGFTLEEVA